MTRFPPALLLAVALPLVALSARAQIIGATPAASQNPLAGSVPVGKPSAEVLQLSLSDAIDRGLRQNLGALLTSDAVASSQGQLGQERSVLLPSISAGSTESVEKVNLAAQGFEKITSRFPGFPLLVGPFGVFDLRVYFSQSLVDLSAWDSERAAQRNLTAARLSYQDAREIVVLVVGAGYLETIAESARVDSADAQLKTAQALYSQAVDLKNSGVTPAIDLLRAQVEQQTRQQQLIAARNNLEKQKLALARLIGVPLGQVYQLTDTAPYEPPTPQTVDQVLERAFAARADLQSALARVHAAEYERHAATAEHLPTLAAIADFGIDGPTPGQTSGSYSAMASLRIPIFAGGRASADARVAQAALDRARQQADDLRAQIEEDVRGALLDLQSASDQVSVAASNVDLAQQTLVQARDRFSAGVTDNIEVVEAQDSVALANESYISSLYAYNLARVELARATGSAEQSVRQYGKGK